ncbi:hypothetical protein ACI78V_22565 [Geodermatophilus sp. SYSU D00742]
MTTAMDQPPPTRQLRITFRQYDGEMLGTCWCGRTKTSAHPRPLWEWLDDHEHLAGDEQKVTDEQ